MSAGAVLARADRGQVWKPLVPAAVVVTLCTGLMVWAEEPRGYLGGALCAATLGTAYVARSVMWSCMGDLLGETAGLTCRPRHGDVLVVPWTSLHQVVLRSGTRRLPAFDFGPRHGPLPVLDLYLRPDLHHPYAPGCAQTPSTPGLSGHGPHTEAGEVAYQLPLLVRPKDLAAVEQRLVEAVGERGIPFSGPTRRTPDARLPWEDADGTS